MTRAREDAMREEPVRGPAARIARALTVLAAMALMAFAPSAPGAGAALGTLTVKGKTTTLKHVVATRENDPEDPDRYWLVVLATDRPVEPADRRPGQLRALAAEGKVKGVRVLWGEGYDRVEAVPYHVDLEVSGMRGPERPTLDLKAYDEKNLEAEVRSKMMGQDWHFQLRLEGPVAKGGVFETEPEATVVSRDTGQGASPEKAKKLELGGLGYEYTEEMFFHAVKDADVPAVKLFLELGQSANAVESATGHVLVTATTFCAHEPTENRGEIVKTLLAAGANPKAADSNDASALLWASQSCPVDVVEALLAAGADVNARAKGSATPLMMAEIFNRQDVVRVLKAAGAKK
jgi:hypothetical protein